MKKIGVLRSFVRKKKQELLKAKKDKKRKK